ncbi:MAG: glucuronate isomerase [Kiritimatiellae bacterium]|jgi:glucuronate isomerase|nr:glucuronate isomerase [Kiritimatiellia bacterium]
MTELHPFVKHNRIASTLSYGLQCDMRNKNFHLGSDTAQRLYHETCDALPVIDFHCHLDPQTLAENQPFAHLAELWVVSDPYKHRAMRIAGVPESEITGGADPKSKFRRWAETLPKTLGNPLYDWSALELDRFFDFHEPLSAENADEVWNHCNALLSLPGYRPRDLLARCKVETVFTSDRLTDDLSHHQALLESDCPTRIHPSLRADDLLEPFPGHSSWDAFAETVTTRLQAFDRLGGRLADHALDSLRFQPTDLPETQRLWERRAAGKDLTETEQIRLRSGLLTWLCGHYARLGWVLQLHIGALRHTSSRLRREAGPAGGYAAMQSLFDVSQLAAFLDQVESNETLPRCILYPLNPALTIPLAVLSGSFVEVGVPGKVQIGPAWWYNDHTDGMRDTFDAITQYSLLSTFPGMTTDSRSLLSMTRHEYFRRVLCDWIGEKVDRGIWPSDPALLNTLVHNLAYGNPASWFLS